MASPASSIPDTHLGLTSAEVQLLRQHQPIALQSAAGSSSARSHASAAAARGLLSLDPNNLRALGAHFDRLMSAIRARVDWVRLLLYSSPDNELYTNLI
jgi:hypothetical protein